MHVCPLIYVLTNGAPLGWDSPVIAFSLLDRMTEHHFGDLPPDDF